MISKYNIINNDDKKNAMKEVLQEIILCGLSRAGFFGEASFYGGTALRIFYGLNRFSEDLDFSLRQSNPDFSFSKYLTLLEKEIRSYGLNSKTEMKNKTIDSNISSAFLKTNTKENLMYFFPNNTTYENVPKNELIKIKIEVDIDPPMFATVEKKYRLQPIPYEVSLYDMSSLFAGKIHAIIGRTWKNRIKGRDLYDYVFYLQNNSSVNLRHLEARLKQSGHIKPNINMTINEIKEMLIDRFESIDYSQAKEDVIPFIRNKAEIDLWSADFFKQITMNLCETKY